MVKCAKCGAPLNDEYAKQWSLCTICREEAGIEDPYPAVHSRELSALESLNTKALNIETHLYAISGNLRVIKNILIAFCFAAALAVVGYIAYIARLRS